MAEATGMSAVKLNMGDLDALRRAQRAHEPSMEEILASIRTIIAEEREPAKGQETKGPKPAAPAPQIVYSKGEPAVERAEVAPQQRPEPAAEANPSKAEANPPKAEANPPKAEADPQTGVWPRAELEVSDAADRPVEDDAPLLSPETDKAVASAFDALSANLAARSAERAGELAREMLRPMLKAWLDENLPGIVERLVRAEIERVARGAR